MERKWKWDRDNVKSLRVTQSKIHEVDSVNCVSMHTFQQARDPGVAWGWAGVGGLSFSSCVLKSNK